MHLCRPCGVSSCTSCKMSYLQGTPPFSCLQQINNAWSTCMLTPLPLACCLQYPTNEPVCICRSDPTFPQAPEDPSPSPGLAQNAVPAQAHEPRMPSLPQTSAAPAHSTHTGARMQPLPQQPQGVAQQPAPPASGATPVHIWLELCDLIALGSACMCLSASHQLRFGRNGSLSSTCLRAK